MAGKFVAAGTIPAKIAALKARVGILVSTFFVYLHFLRFFCLFWHMTNNGVFFSQAPPLLAPPLLPPPILPPAIAPIF